MKLENLPLRLIVLSCDQLVSLYDLVNKSITVFDENAIITTPNNNNLLVSEITNDSSVYFLCARCSKTVMQRGISKVIATNISAITGEKSKIVLKF